MWVYQAVTNVGIQVMLLMGIGWFFARFRILEQAKFLPQANMLVLWLVMPCFNLYLMGIRLDLQDLEVWKSYAAFQLWVTITQAFVVLYGWIRKDAGEAAVVNMMLLMDNYGIVGLLALNATLGTAWGVLSLLVGIAFFLFIFPFSLVAFEWEKWAVQQHVDEAAATAAADIEAAATAAAAAEADAKAAGGCEGSGPDGVNGDEEGELLGPLPGAEMDRSVFAEPPQRRDDGEISFYGLASAAAAAAATAAPDADGAGATLGAPTRASTRAELGARGGPGGVSGGEVELRPMALARSTTAGGTSTPTVHGGTGTPPSRAGTFAEGGGGVGPAGVERSTWGERPVPPLLPQTVPPDPRPRIDPPLLLPLPPSSAPSLPYPQRPPTGRHERPSPASSPHQSLRPSLEAAAATPRPNSQRPSFESRGTSQPQSQRPSLDAARAHPIDISRQGTYQPPSQPLPTSVGASAAVTNGAGGGGDWTAAGPGPIASPFSASAAAGWPAPLGPAAPPPSAAATPAASMTPAPAPSSALSLRGRGAPSAQRQSLPPPFPSGGGGGGGGGGLTTAATGAATTTAAGASRAGSLLAAVFDRVAAAGSAQLPPGMSWDVVAMGSAGDASTRAGGAAAPGGGGAGGEGIGGGGGGAAGGVVAGASRAGSAALGARKRSTATGLATSYKDLEFAMTHAISGGTADQLARAARTFTSAAAAATAAAASADPARRRALLAATATATAPSLPSPLSPNPPRYSSDAPSGAGARGGSAATSRRSGEATAGPAAAPPPGPSPFAAAAGSPLRAPSPGTPGSPAYLSPAASASGAMPPPSWGAAPATAPTSCSSLGLGPIPEALEGSSAAAAGDNRLLGTTTTATATGNGSTAEPPLLPTAITLSRQPVVPPSSSGPLYLHAPGSPAPAPSPQPPPHPHPAPAPAPSAPLLGHRTDSAPAPIFSFGRGALPTVDSAVTFPTSGPTLPSSAAAPTSGTSDGPDAERAWTSGPIMPYRGRPLATTMPGLAPAALSPPVRDAGQGGVAAAAAQLRARSVGLPRSGGEAEGRRRQQQAREAAAEERRRRREAQELEVLLMAAAAGVTLGGGVRAGGGGGGGGDRKDRSRRSGRKGEAARRLLPDPDRSARLYDSRQPTTTAFSDAYGWAASLLRESTSLHDSPDTLAAAGADAPTSGGYAAGGGGTAAAAAADRKLVREATQQALARHGGLAGAAAAFVRGHPQLWHILGILGKSPMTWSLFASVALSASGLRVFLDPVAPQYRPELGWVAGTLQWIVGLVVPLSLFSNGAWMYGKRLLPQGELTKLVVMMLLKITVLPFLMVGCALAVGLTGQAVAALTVLTLSPAAAMSFVLAVQYGRGVEMVTMSNIIGSLFMTPLLILWIKILGAIGIEFILHDDVPLK
ncbi:hypothetical protein HYH03_002886 [Edaphochlamys debaryana]|uniref:Auxin efflux carrier component n=1 Tax=Edaphochlamys debaryana TaxID=47281 RepID=A0A835YAW7_9CHLO|nr:hypothetical protein HYH03_002886 [Edaphochlamys debaryana]|eukprot:KAG2499308.1 hypothetical protein HYH03_002886 [Edaphochlamys debaryana]